MINNKEMYLFDLQGYCKQNYDGYDYGSLQYFWEEHRDKDLRVIVNIMDDVIRLWWVTRHLGTYHNTVFSSQRHVIEPYLLPISKYLDLELLI